MTGSSSGPKTSPPPSRMRRRPVPSCPLCGRPGAALHRGLRDRFAALPEEWSFSRCGDASCGLLWLDPMPIEEDIGHAYRDDYYTHRDEPTVLTWYRRAFRWLKQGYLARRYGYRLQATSRPQQLLGLAVWLMPRRRLAVDAGVMDLAFRPGGRLLEVGCGGGAILGNLQALGWQTEGVDFDPTAVAHARSKGLTVHLGPLADHALPAGRFDAIVMSHVIEHVHDPGGLLRECRRLLKPDGTLVVLTPNAEGLCHRVFGASCFTLEPPRHLHMFNPRNLRKLVTEAAFTVSRSRTRSRGGRDYFRLSQEIEKTGRVDTSRRRTLAATVGGLAFELLEAAFLVARPEAGDEIVLIARPR